MLRDNVKKEITPQLAACIHAPRTATTRGRRTRDLGHSLSGEAPGTPGNTALTMLHLQSIKANSMKVQIKLSTTRIMLLHL